MHTMLLVRTHIGILLSFCILKKKKKKKKKSVPPCTLDRLIVVVSVAKHIRIVSLPGRFISSFLFFFFLSFLSLFFFFFFSKGEWVYSPIVNWVWPGIFFCAYMLYNLLSGNFYLLPVPSNPSRALFCRGGVPPSDSGGPRQVWTERLLIIIPTATKLGGYIGFTLSVCLSVRLSVCLCVNLSCPPWSIYNSGWILSIFGTNDQ